jgi:succinate dehydrogenase hydrophobic anchor subunit
MGGQAVSAVLTVFLIPAMLIFVLKYEKQEKVNNYAEKNTGCAVLHSPLSTGLRSNIAGSGGQSAG